MKASRKTPAALGTLVIAGENTEQDIVLQLNILEETNISLDSDIKQGKKKLESLRSILKRLNP